MSTQKPIERTDAPAEETRATVDVEELTARVKEMYRSVAEDPGGERHFHVGRPIAETLGYPPQVVDQIPAEAVESFAGTGYYFDLAGLAKGEQVLDLGSGSGMDTFFAALQVGSAGHVTGVDMTEPQLDKAERSRTRGGFDHVTFHLGRIENVPVADASIDVVISNGVFNLAPDKHAVFAEAARVLRPGGRLAISDVVTEVQIGTEAKAQVDLWAACIGGASQEGIYRRGITDAGLQVKVTRSHHYDFRSEQARNASAHFGVKCVTLLARKA